MEKKKNYYAHIKICDDGTEKFHTVAEHCTETAEYAEKTLADIGFGKTAYLAGLLHDCGKFTDEFQDYLWKAVRGEKVVRGSVNHTFAGVRYILDVFHGQQCQSIGDVVAEIIAYAIGAHHGLFDAVDENGKNGFKYRQEKNDYPYQEAIDNCFDNFTSKQVVCELFEQAKLEIVSFNNKLGIFCCDGTEGEFYYGMLARLILSAVIEGDRRSTVEFEIGKRNVKAMSREDWNQLYERVTDGVYKLGVDSPIGKVRRQLSDMCVKSAEKAGGIYKLNIPTGGGKTLSSLRYALKHASNCGKNCKKRIFFVIPLLAIIEQNAKDIRDYVQDDSIILEHHSNVIGETEKDSDELNKKELLTETWDAPIVITTLVQMLYTLFKGKTTSIRRFKSLANSIIIFDEIQTVPDKMLWMFNLAINFLSNICGATVILCSATQPCLEKVEHPMRGISNLIDIKSAELKVFERVKLINKKNMSNDEFYSFVNEQISQHLSVLVICNTKNEANRVYEQLSKEEDIAKIYLSANLCTKHREVVVDKLKKLLSNNERVVCISTQVIEAGVDVSFACVIRLQAGMDSIVQAAGRCNRHGEKEGLAPVYIVSLANEKLDMLPEIRDAKNATTELLEQHNVGNEKYENLMCDASISFYYKKLYDGMTNNYQGFCKGNRMLFSLLADNESCFNENCEDEWNKSYLHQAFKTVGKEFEVFEQETFDVIVPYEFGKEVIQHLCDKSIEYDLLLLKNWIDKAKGYTVSVFNYQLKKLMDNAGVTQVKDMNLYVLDDNFYKPDIGLVFENILVK